MKRKNVNSNVVMDLTKISPVFKDSRGDILDILEGQHIMHIGLLKSNPGSISGNHYHKKSTQWTYVIEGKIKVQ